MRVAIRTSQSGRLHSPFNLLHFLHLLDWILGGDGVGGKIVRSICIQRDDMNYDCLILNFSTYPALYEIICSQRLPSFARLSNEPQNIDRILSRDRST
jgi:hypothetical protein